MSTTTPNLNLTKPTVGSDNNTWGAGLDATIDVLDGLFPGGVLALNKGGTGQNTAAGARTNLGVLESPISSGTIAAASGGIAITAIPATYNKLFLNAENLEPVNDGDNLILRIGIVGVAGVYKSGANDYQYTAQGSGSASAVPITGLNSTVAGVSGIVLSGPFTNSANVGSSLEVWLNSTSSNIHIRWVVSYRLQTTLELTRFEGGGALQGFAGPVTDLGVSFSTGGSANMKKALYGLSGRTLG